MRNVVWKLIQILYLLLQQQQFSELCLDIGETSIIENNNSYEIIGINNPFFKSKMELLAKSLEFFELSYSVQRFS